MISQEDYAKLIHPWQAHYDETWKRNYFFNPETNESLWVLPTEISDRVQEYYQDQIEDVFEETNNVVKYIAPSERMSKDNTEVLKRPARKQVEVSLARNFAYQQGDEEYNIWYDKYLSDKKDKEREAAATRCEPEVDAGYTKSDKMEKYSTYFCIHFARGCCAEGANCKFYHRIPTQDESSQIDQVKDIFGRPRFANHRDDLEGTGTFLKDCRTLAVTDFKMPTGNDPIAATYEILWRHFSPWGEIEDINLHPGKGLAYIRYSHRCMAEFAKIAMLNQSLDADEILTIKWAPEDEDAEEAKEDAKKKDKNNKKRRKPKDKSTKPLIEDKFEAGYGEESEAKGDNEEEKILKKRKKEIESSLNDMSDVLKRIERQNQGLGDENEGGDDQNQGAPNEGEGPKNHFYHPKYGYVNPKENNLPLF